MASAYREFDPQSALVESVHYSLIAVRNELAFAPEEAKPALEKRIGGLERLLEFFMSPPATRFMNAPDDQPEDQWPEVSSVVFH